jgi:hypothetical protein
MAEMLEISYTLELAFQEIEKQLDAKLLIESINEAIGPDFGLKSGLEIAKRIIGKIENDGYKSATEASLVKHIIDVFYYLY